jgi:hypothetical protein
VNKDEVTIQITIKGVDPADPITPFVDLICAELRTVFRECLAEHTGVQQKRPAISPDKIPRCKCRVDPFCVTYSRWSGKYTPKCRACVAHLPYDVRVPLHEVPEDAEFEHSSPLPNA